MKGRISLKGLAVNTLHYTIGSLLLSLGLYTFALHAQFAPGGVSGISIMLNHFTGWPIGIVILTLNLPLIAICARVVGGAFVVRSVYTMLINILFMDFVFPLFPSYYGNPLLAAMFTGICMGAGLAIIYMRGSSSGGVDFITMSIKKMQPHFSIGQITMAIDAVVILTGGAAFGNIDAVLYGLVASITTNLTMDNLLYGAGSSKMAIVITTRGQQIARAISAEVARGSTLVPAIGAYTGEGREMLLCVCSKNEIYKVRTTARALDPGSILIITEVSEVFGEGFSPLALPGNENEPQRKRKKKR